MRPWFPTMNIGEVLKIILLNRDYKDIKKTFLK